MTTQGDQDKPVKHPSDALEAVEAVDDYGIDISQLRDNLRLTVVERLRRHQIALNTVELLQKAKRL